MNEVEALAAFNALSNPTRLRVLKSLVTAGSDGLQAGDIAKLVGATPSRASFHLSAMSEAGLITSTRQARQIIYSANFESVGALIRYLMEDCCNNNATVRASCLTQDCC